jgi:serine/threonine protein kinase
VSFGETDQMKNQVDKWLGPYLVRSLIGEGGFSTVYEVWDSENDLLVAMKILKPEYSSDAVYQRMFFDEYQLASQLDHPNIISVYNSGIDDGYSFFTMELLQNSVGNLINAAKGPLPLSQTSQLIQDICKGLGFAHDRGVIHCDIKVENLMIANDGSGVITDFGGAEFLYNSPNLKDQTGFRTPEYMSPEQVREDPLDCRSDIYSLGVAMYEMVTGEVPFNGEPEEISWAHLSKVPKLPRKIKRRIPSWIEDAILKALAKDPIDRFQTAQEFEASIGGRGDDADTGSYKKRTSSKMPVLLGSITALICCVVLVVVFFKTPSEMTEKPPQYEQQPERPIVAPPIVLSGGIPLDSLRLLRKSGRATVSNFERFSNNKSNVTDGLKTKVQFIQNFISKTEEPAWIEYQEAQKTLAEIKYAISKWQIDGDSVDSTGGGELVSDVKKKNLEREQNKKYNMKAAELITELEYLKTQWRGLSERQKTKKLREELPGKIIECDIALGSGDLVTCEQLISEIDGLLSGGLNAWIESLTYAQVFVGKQLEKLKMDLLKVRLQEFRHDNHIEIRALENDIKALKDSRKYVEAYKESQEVHDKFAVALIKHLDDWLMFTDSMISGYKQTANPDEFTRIKIHFDNAQKDRNEKAILGSLENLVRTCNAIFDLQ